MWKIDKKLNFRNYQTESYASLTYRGIQAFLRLHSLSGISSDSMCWELCALLEGFFWARRTIRNKLSSFPTWNFVVFLWKRSFVAQWKFTTKTAIFRRVQTQHTRIFIIFILKTTSKGSHVGKTLRSRLIHTLTWLHFDYHWLCVWFGSCENQHLTQSRFSGVLHCWPGLKNASAAPNKISRT